jgi:OmcA/MtrC family decaheme c-type cytochrome
MGSRYGLGLFLAAAIIAAGTAGACSNSEPDDGVGGMGGSSIGGAGGTDTGSGGGTITAGVTGGGLLLDIVKVAVSPAGVATVEFTITDAEGRPLDREGKLTYGAVSPSFILSWLGENEEGESTQYTAYTLRTKSTADGETAVQSATDTGGTYETLALGHYRYTLGTAVNLVDDEMDRRGLTHSLGVYATRQLDETRFVATAVESWVPDGSPVETVLDVVNTEACNSCHTRLEAHGGARRGVEMCNLCHTEANSINPESGNTIDFQVMVHKIHMGENLPSVVAGDPYYIIGFNNSNHDYSEVAYPWTMTDCAKCHQGTQGDRWYERPAEKPCSSCHDRTYFGTGDPPEGWTAHSGGPRDDSECIVCHATDSIESITKLHKSSLSDPARPVVAAEILGIEDTAPGQLPALEFAVTVNGVPVDMLGDAAQRLNRVRMRVFGPTSDVNRSWFETIEESGVTTAVPCDSAFTPPCLESLGDTFVYYAVTPIPADVTGSFMVGLDGRISDPVYGNVAFLNPIETFAITGEVTERRAIVDRAHCNSCHGDLGEHGGGYKDPLYCMNCHNTTAVLGVEDPLPPGESVVETGLNLKDFIHRIHSSVGYPAPLNDCEQCHLAGTYGVPLADGLLASTYATLSCPSTLMSCDGGMGGGSGEPVSTAFLVQPESAACTSCHSDSAAVAHAETNTGMSGEACGTCHGDGKVHDVAMVHALEP